MNKLSQKYFESNKFSFPGKSYEGNENMTFDYGTLYQENLKLQVYNLKGK